MNKLTKHQIEVYKLISALEEYVELINDKNDIIPIHIDSISILINKFLKIHKKTEESILK